MPIEMHHGSGCSCERLEPWTPDDVDARVEAVQATSAQPMFDAGCRDAGLEELPAVHDPTLKLRDSRNLTVTGALNRLEPPNRRGDR
jgi:hypothetical protein